MSELEHCLLLLSGCPGGREIRAPSTGHEHQSSVLLTSSTDSRSCGLDIEHELSRIIEAVTSHIAKKTDHSSNASARLSSTHAQRCQLLVNRAKEAIATYPYSEVPVHWRRLYMDASLLQVVATAAVMTFSADAEDRKSSPTEDQTELLELVRVLDMANIVAAYFDQGRREAFFGLMRFLQSRLDRHFGTDTDSSCRLAPAKRRRIDPEGARFKDWKGFLLPGIKEIETYSVDDAPSFEELPFQTEPFVVKGPVASWPAIADSATSWKDEKYLLRIAGKGRLVPVEIGSSYTAEGWTQKIVAFDTFLREIDWQEDVEHRKPDKNESPSSSPMYLAQHDLFQQFPALLSDILVPDYVYADMQAPDHFPGYRPPAAEAGYTINAWMGPAGTYSPAHTDPFYNCYGKLDRCRSASIKSSFCFDVPSFSDL